MAQYICCSRCRREISTANWTRHASACFETGEHRPWNAGLSADQNPAFADQLKAGGRSLAKKVAEGFVQARVIKVKTDEYRAEKSAWRKELHRTNPETHPNRRLAGNRSSMSYPERLVYDYLKEKNIQFEHQKRIEGFYPDFALGKLLLEVDGKRWHDAERDARRDGILSNAGYRVVRFEAGPKLIERVEEFLTKEKLV